MKSTPMHSEHALSPIGDGEKLYNYLRANGITQTELAERIGVTPYTVALYCQSYILRKSIRNKVLTALGVDSEVVFGKVKPVQQTPEPTKPILADDCALTIQMSINRQLYDWQTRLAEFKARQAPLGQLQFCEYQIAHLELSRSIYERF